MSHCCYCSLTWIDCRCRLSDNPFSDTSSELVGRIVVGDRHGAERLRPTQVLLVATQIVSKVEKQSVTNMSQSVTKSTHIRIKGVGFEPMFPSSLVSL